MWISVIHELQLQFSLTKKKKWRLLRILVDLLSWMTGGPVNFSKHVFFIKTRKLKQLFTYHVNWLLVHTIYIRLGRISRPIRICAENKVSSGGENICKVDSRLAMLQGIPRSDLKKSLQFNSNKKQGTCSLLVCFSAVLCNSSYLMHLMVAKSPILLCSLTVIRISRGAESALWVPRAPANSDV